MAGVLRSGDIAYVVYYMSDKGEGIHVTFEETMITQMTKGLDNVKHTKIIFAGKSLEELWKLIFNTKVPKKLKSGRTPFAFAYEDFAYNVLFFERTKNGALQAQIIAVSNYRKKIAGYFCSGKTDLPVTLSYCDGLYKDEPVIVAVDMDLKRLRNALEQSEACGKNSPSILCLEFQEKMLNLFLNHYEIQSAKIFTLSYSEINDVMPEMAITEFTNEPIRDKKGGCITVR